MLSSAGQAGVGTVALTGETGAKIEVVADLLAGGWTVLRIPMVVRNLGERGSARLEGEGAGS